MIEDVIERWHRHLRGELPGGLDAMLDDDVTFYSPIVFSPQRGKEVTKLYLSAAAASFAGPPGRADAPIGAEVDAVDHGGFRYTKQVLAGDTAVLEFETTMEGKYVNGVDIITINDSGRIIEFRVMIRPLQAVDTVHSVMRSAMESAGPEPAGPVAVDDFDEKAATWDDDPAHVERASAVARAISSGVPLDGQMGLLEYGAGTALVAQALKDQVGRVVLADTSQGMRDVIRSKIDAGLLGDARILELDLSNQPPPDERFELIVTVLTLHHVADIAPVLAGFAEMLEPHGKLCVVDLEEEDGSFHGEGFAGHHGFARSDLADALDAVGLGRVTFSECHRMVRDGVEYPLFLAIASSSVPKG